MTQSSPWAGSRAILVEMERLEDAHEDDRHLCRLLSERLFYSRPTILRHLYRLAALGFVSHRPHKHDWRTTPAGRLAARDPRPPMDDLPRLRDYTRLRGLAQCDASTPTRPPK